MQLTTATTTLRVKGVKGRQADFGHEQPEKSADGSPQRFATTGVCRLSSSSRVLETCRVGSRRGNTVWSKHKNHGPGCKTVISLERNGCGLRPDQGTRKSWGTGSSGMGRINRDRALLQGAQDPAAPRERQGWHQGKPSTHASPPRRTRSAFTPNYVTRPMGQQSGMVCDDCRSSIVG